MPHRADHLLRQKQQQLQEWQFERMPEAYVQTYDLEGFDFVYDNEKQGLWFRKQDPLSRDQNSGANYEPKRTRFSDTMKGISYLAQGLGLIDQASDGELGNCFFEMFQSRKVIRK